MICGQKKRRDEKRGDIDMEGKTRLFIAKGKKDGFTPRILVDYLWDKARVKGFRIDGVECFDVFSFITVSFNDAEKIINALKKYNRGNKPMAEIAKGREKGSGAKDRRSSRRNRGGSRSEFVKSRQSKKSRQKRKGSGSKYKN